MFPPKNIRCNVQTSTVSLTIVLRLESAHRSSSREEAPTDRTKRQHNDDDASDLHQEEGANARAGKR